MSNFRVYRDFPSFDAVRKTPLKTIDFEDLPYSASSCVTPPTIQPSIPNPLMLQGVTFRDPYCLRTCYNAPLSDNELALNVGGTIDLPAKTVGVMLSITGMGDLDFEVKVIDFQGEYITENGQGITNDYVFLGFASSSGIRRIEVMSTGGGVYGPLAISEILFFRGKTTAVSKEIRPRSKK